MTRQTSIEVFYQIRDEGLLSKRRFQVYECIFNTAGLTGVTQGECSKMLQNEIVGRNGHQSITPRFAELKRLGVITQNGTRQCTVTGRKCIAWITTNNLPVNDPDFKISTKERIRLMKGEIEGMSKEIDRLKAENQGLRRLLNQKQVGQGFLGF